MITFNSNSPINPDITSGYSLWYAKVQKMFFTSDISTLYVLITRFDGNKYNVLSQLKLKGFDDNSVYNYKIDFSKYLRFVKDISSLNISLQQRDGYVQIPMYDMVNVINIFISSTDILSDNYALIDSAPNGEKSISDTNINSISADQFSNSFIFTQVKNNSTIYGDTKFYNNARYGILLYPNGYYGINYLKFYDKNNTLISGYGTQTPVNGILDYYTYLTYSVPTNAFKIEYQARFGSYTQNRTYYTAGCATNQYFYYSPEYIFTSIEFTGKRESVMNVEKLTLDRGDYTDVIDIKYTPTYTQNTGLKLKEDTYLELLKTPEIYEIYYDTIYGEYRFLPYVINNTSANGYNTRSYGNRNDTLTLTSVNKYTYHTQKNNNFFE